MHLEGIVALHCNNDGIIYACAL